MRPSRPVSVRTVRRGTAFIKPVGTVTCVLEDGRSIEIPIAPGILKHPRLEELEGLLRMPDVARKYAREALRVAPWGVVRAFPRDWLVEVLEGADLPTGRRQALEFMLDVSPPDGDMR